MVENHRTPNPGAPAPGLGRRRALRHTILQRCFAWQANQAEERWRAIAFDISSEGIGLAVPHLLPRDSALIVEAWELPGARPLHVIVAHAQAVEGVWFLGCRFVRPLEQEELHVWLGLSSGWLANDPVG